MSAESPRRGPPAPATHICHNVQLSGGDGSNASTNNVVRCVPAVVPPQPVNDRTIIDSVTGFISDVTLQTAAPLTDAKDTVLWARFEPCADISDLNFGPDWDLEGGVAPPLLLILGYGNGVQVWVIPANGEASEVLSWRHGNVRVLRILPTPMWQTHGQLADEPMDQFSVQRPLMAVCDNSSQYYAVNFVSLRDGSMCRSIKFKSPILDILANRYSIVVTFQERIAVFDARNFEDRLTVTTCHPSPGINPNPVALGSRWLAYAEQKLMTSKRSNGGCDCDGVTSYTATVLNAAKSLGKGLRELGEQVAAGLSGTSPGSGSSHSLSGHSGSSGNSNQGRTATKEPGVITILDIKHAIKEVSPTTGAPVTSSGVDPMVAHFVAHSDAVVALAFDPSGMLLLTADKRGHDFHVFRIFPHPGGAAQAAAHHLYVLHRGDTTSKVQDIAFSLDSRWVSISTLRGTTHVFPVTPYGGPAGVRTHGSPHVVNRLSRFHRSAGLSIDGRSSSPLSHSFDYTCNQQTTAYSNPRVAPFPHPTVVLPLAQVRQPSSLSSTQTSAGQRAGAAPSSRQRLSSASDDAAKPMRVCAAFGRARSWLLEPREQHSIRWQKKPVDALFIVASHGALIQYDLEPRHTINIPKEKVSDDTPIELDVVPKAQWNLLRKSSSAMEGDCGFMDIQPPLPKENWLLKDRCFIDESGANEFERTKDERDDRWLSQVEIITHAGPHRRLWMGPQFTFKTYNTPSGAPLAHIDSEAVEIGIGGTGIGASSRPARSNPMNMPHSAVPVLIESGSCSSHEQSPRLMDQYRHEHMDSDFSLGPGESQLREDLADAMRETPGGCQSRDHTDGPTSSGSSTIIGGIGGGTQSVVCIDQEELSSSSFSSASRASLDPPSSSPTASYSGENVMSFYGDSSNSL